MVDNPKILVLSSVSPTIGPAIIGEQYYESLRRKGLEVDFMTKYPEPEHPEYLWAVKDGYDRKWIVRIKNKLRWLLSGGGPKKSGYFFFYSYEKWPPVPSRRVVDAIKKQYDFVIVVFWQGLLSFDTIERIYDKLHCLFLFLAVDYSSMSGGCHFTGDCQNYKTGCGRCPAFCSKWKGDFTSWNVKFRKRVYEKVKPIVVGNLYMSQFYKESYLLRDARIAIGEAPIIDTEIFRPMDNARLRDKYQIPPNKTKILFFGCQDLDDERKGIKYLLESFELLCNEMAEESKSVFVITAGNGYDKIKEKVPFESVGVGYIPMNQLPELYSLATCFVCPSVNDAGPMMVNQSLCCGTPVVGFEMGAVKQLVKDKGTGICVPLRDSRALADGIMQIFNMPFDTYQEMSNRAREVALQTSSYDAQADEILLTYEKYKKLQ